MSVPEVAEAEVMAARQQLATEHPEAATLMAACDVAKVLQKKGYEVIVSPVRMFFPAPRPGGEAAPPEPSCEIQFVNPTTRLAKATAMTLGDYPSVLAAARNMVPATSGRLHIPGQMGPLKA